MTGGFIAGVQSPGISYTMVTGITKAGTLVSKNTTLGQMDVTGAGAKPDGYTMSTTVDVFGTTQTGVQAAVLPLIEGNVIEIPLLATNAEIAVGDEIETVAGGLVDKKNGAGEVVGIALAAVAANAGTWVKILVSKYTASA